MALIGDVWTTTSSSSPLPLETDIAIEPLTAADSWIPVGRVEREENGLIGHTATAD
jgi:hypothetical protein